VKLAGNLRPAEILGPRPEGEGVWVPPAQRLALAAMALDRRMGRLNLVDVWRALLPGSPAGLARPPVPPTASAAALEALATADGGKGLPVAFFHPGARAALRRWPPERHALLAAALRRRKPFTAAVLGSRRERALALKFLDVYAREAPGAPAADLTGKTGLADLWALLADAGLLVSSDTGVMHMGASLGAPQLAVFAGPAYAHETGPYSDGALVLQGLAPCGPCADGKGCSRPACRALPPFEAALPLAAGLLEGSAEGGAGSRGGPGHPPPPPGPWQSWRTRTGGRGASLVPCGPFPAPLDGSALAGLLFREGARAAVPLGPQDGPGDRGGGPAGAVPGRISGAGGEEGLAGEIALYGRGARPDLKRVRACLSFVGKRALDGRDREAFREAWEGALAEARKAGAL
jgi:hypothetical protein